MDTVLVARVTLILTGVLFLCLDFYHFSKKQLAVTIGVGWGFVSVLLIMIGSVPGLSAWISHMNIKTFLAAYLLGFIAMLGILFLSISISQLVMKNQELAMQVSLLNQENEIILREINRLSEGGQ